MWRPEFFKGKGVWHFINHRVTLLEQKNGSRLLYPRRELARRGERVCTPHLAHHQELYKRNESAGAWQRWGLPPHTGKPFDGELKKPVTKRYQKTLKMIQVWNENTLTYIHGRFYDHHLTAFTRLLVSRYKIENRDRLLASGSQLV